MFDDRHKYLEITFCRDCGIINVHQNKARDTQTGIKQFHIYNTKVFSFIQAP